MKCLQTLIVLIFITHLAASCQNQDYRFFPNLVVAMDTADWATYTKIENKLTPHDRLIFGHRRRIGLYLEITTNHYTGSRYIAEMNSESERSSTKTYKERPITMILPSLTECVNGAFGTAIEPKGTIWASLKGSKKESMLNVKMEFSISDSTYAIREVEKLIDQTSAQTPEELDQLYGYPLSPYSADSIYKRRFQEVQHDNQQFYEKNARCLSDPNILELLKSKNPADLIDSLVEIQNVSALSVLYGKASAENSLSNFSGMLFERSRTQFNHREYFTLRDSLLSGTIPLAEFRNRNKKLRCDFPFDRYSELELCGSEITTNLSGLAGASDSELLFEQPFLLCITHQIFGDSLFVHSIRTVSGDCDYLLAELLKNETTYYCLLRYSLNLSTYEAFLIEVEKEEISSYVTNMYSHLYRDFILLQSRGSSTKYHSIPLQAIHTKIGTSWTSIPEYPLSTMPGIFKYTGCLNFVDEIPLPYTVCINESDLNRSTELLGEITDQFKIVQRYKYIAVITDSDTTIHKSYYINPIKESSLKPSEKSFTTSLIECDFNQDGNNELLQYTVSQGKLIHYVYYDNEGVQLVEKRSRQIERHIKKTQGFRNMVLLSKMGPAD